MKKIHYTLFIILILLTQTSTLLAGPGNFSWKGAISTAWSNPANWAPNGVPSSGDTILYDPTAGTYSLTLDSNKTVNLFTILSGTIDISTKTLTITGTAVFGGGQISNGHLVVSNSSSVTFSGTTFSAVVNITCNSVYLNGSTFNDSLSITKNGSSNDNSKGNNTYNKSVSIANTYIGSIVLSDSFPDTFNKALYVKNINEKGFVYLAHRAARNIFNEDVTMTGRNIYSNYYGTAEYKGNITVNCPNGEVYFGTSTGSCTLANGRKIALGDSAFSAGRLVLKNFTKLGTDGVTSLTLTGSASMNFVSSVFNTDVTVVAPSINVQSTRFIKDCSLTKSGSGTQTSIGGNYFGGITTIVNNHSSGTFTLGSTTVDTFVVGATIKNQAGTLQINNAQFNDTVRIINTESSTTNDRLYFANTGSVRFKKSVTIQNSGSGLCFGNSNGATQLDSARTLTFVSGLTGNITLQHFTQIGTGNHSISFPSDAAKLILGPNTIFNANFTYYGKNVSLNGVTFNAAASITKYGVISDTCAGGNVFNGSAVIKDSLTATHKFILAYTTADDYNGNVTFVQKGTGAAMYPSYTKNSTFAGNITVDANTSFQFGGNGGKVILDGTGNQILSNLSSGTMTMKKLQLNKASNSFTLSSPLSISDSLVLTKGWINTDTTNILSLVNGSKLLGGSDSSYINGPVKKTGNVAFVFPTGSSALGHPYHPLEITAPASSSDAYTANYFSNGQSIGTAIDTSIDNLNGCQYWKLNRNSGTSKVKVKLGWNHDSCETISPIKFRVTGWNGTIWKNLGNSVTSGDSIQGMVQSVDSLNTITILTLAFKKCSAYRKNTVIVGPSCIGANDGQIQVIAMGGTSGYSFNWSDGKRSNVVSDLSSGKYNFSVEDSRGCYLMDSVQVSDPDSIKVTFSTEPTSCSKNLGEVSAMVTGGAGGYKYRWMSNGDTTNHISNLATGLYNILVTDSLGCIVSARAKINSTDGPEVGIQNLVLPSCFNANDGIIEVTPTSGNSPFKYKWGRFNNDTLTFMDKLRAGKYPIQITDQNGCVSFDTFTLSQPDTFEVKLEVTGTPCGFATGEILARIKGGEAPLTLEWSGSSVSDSLISNLPPGNDTLIVTDANGCKLISTGEVKSTSGISLVSNVITNVICFPDSGGAARVIVTGGTSPFTFDWGPIENTNDTATNLQPGIYKIKVVDNNGCRTETEVEIISPEELVATVAATYPSSDSAMDGSIKTLVFGGTAPYTYLWSNSSVGADLNNIGFGNYTLNVMDANGCRRSVNTDLQFKPPFLRCYNCPQVSSLSSCGPWTPSYCTTCPVIIKYITDFGAIPDDGRSDECAFEEASNYFSSLNSLVRKILIIPLGTYIVGAQYDTPPNFIEGDWHRLGASALCLEGVYNMEILGEIDLLNPLARPIIRFENCMKYGVFDVDNNPDNRFLGGSERFFCTVTNGSATLTLLNGITTALIGVGYNVSAVDALGNIIVNGQVNSLSPTNIAEFTISNVSTYTSGDYELIFSCAVSPVDYRYAATVGNIIHLSECVNIKITNLELDGNIENAIIGGGLSDGIQLPYTGIWCTSSRDVDIENLFVHHFGWDGIYIGKPVCHAYTDLQPVYYRDVNVNIDRSIFSYNGRNGMSWTGGRHLTVTNSEFSFTGLSRVSMQPGAGIDIEWELSTYPPAIGNFFNCRFQFNINHGLINDAQSNYFYQSRNFHFEECIFVGSELGDAVYPKGRDFSFLNCNLFGQVWNCFDSQVNTPARSLTNVDNTRFTGCDFLEEFQDQNGDIFSFSNSNEVEPDPFNPGQLRAGPGPIPGHSPLFDASHSGRVQLTNCYIHSNFTRRIAYINYEPYQLPPFNFPILDGVIFHNGGMNEINCESDINVVRNCIIGQGNADVWYFNPMRNPGALCTTPPFSDYTVNASFLFQNPTPDPRGSVIPLGFFPPSQPCFSCGTSYETLRLRYLNPVILNSALPLFSYPCVSIPPYLSPACTIPPLRKKATATILDNYDAEFGKELIISPNPSSNLLLIENLEKESIVQIFNAIGNLVDEFPEGVSNIQVDISKYVSGIYLIKAGNQKPIKFIKS